MNQAVVQTVISTFICPSTQPSVSRTDDQSQPRLHAGPGGRDGLLSDYRRGPRPGDLRFRHHVGTEGILPQNTTPSFAQVTDGLSDTVLFAESAGRPYLYQRGVQQPGYVAGPPPTGVQVNGGGWARPASDMTLWGRSMTARWSAGPIGPPVQPERLLDLALRRQPDQWRSG